MGEKLGDKANMRRSYYLCLELHSRLLPSELPNKETFEMCGHILSDIYAS